MTDHLDVDYLKDFGRKLEYKLIEIFDAQNSSDEDQEKKNDVWLEVYRHFTIKKTLLAKFEGKDLYIEKVKKKNHTYIFYIILSSFLLF